MRQPIRIVWHGIRAVLALLLLIYASTASAQQLPRTSGSITAGGSDCSVSTRCVSLNASGQAADSAAILVSGTWSATPVVEIAIDPNGTWTLQPETFNLATGAASSTIAGNGYYIVPLRGAQAVRVRATSHSTGTVVVAIGTAPASGGIAITQPLPAGSAALGSVSVSSAALPTGASTSAKQDTGNASLASIDGKITAVNTGNVTVSSSALPTGAATAANQATGNTSLGTIAGAVSASKMQVDVVTSALPTGAATAANQSTGNTSLASIDTKTPALGQALAAASVPVVLTAAQLSTLTPLATIAATQSGSWTVQPGNTANTTPWLFSISQGGNTAAVNASSQLSVNCANCSGTGVSHQDNAGFTPGTTNFVPMGGIVDDTGTTATSENSAGVARMTAQRGIHTNLRNASGTEVGTSSTPLQVSLANTASNATAVKVDNSAVTQPVSGTVTANVGTFPDNEPFNVAQINGVAPSMGNGVSGTGVQRVTIASDSTGTVAATQSGTWNVNNIAGTVSLPTGAATSANQTTEITALQLIDNLPNTLGSTTSGQSGALALGAVTTAAPTYTNAQSNALSLTTAGALRTDASATTQPVSAASLPLPSGASTLAEQQTQTTALQTIDNIVSGTGANISQFGGSNVVTGTGAAGSGVPRVTVSNDSSVIVGTFPDNEPFNVAQINGVAPSMGNGASGTGVQRVTIANDSTGVLAQVTDTRQATASNLNAQVVGNVASGTADSGNPVKAAGVAKVASEATPAYVAAASRADLWAERDGSLVVSNREWPRVDATWGTTTSTCSDVNINACGAGSYLELDVNRAGSAIFWMRPDVTGNVTGGQITFDMSVNGGTTWVEASCSNGDYTQTTVLLSGSTFLDGSEAGWRCPPQAADRLRMRLESAVTCQGGAGSCTLTVSGRATAVAMSPFTIARQGDATRLNAQVQGSVANGSTASASENPLKNGGVAYGVAGETMPTLTNFPTPVSVAAQATALLSQYNEYKVVQGDKYLSSSIAANGVSVTFPLEGMGTLVIAVPSSTFTGTTIYEQSIDQSTWVTATGFDNALGTYALATGLTCAGTCAGAWQMNILNGYRWMRVRSTAWTSGTMNIRIIGYNGIRAYADTYSVPIVRQDHPNRFRCTVTTSTATTLQAVGGSCAAPGAGLSIYITDIKFSASAAGIAADAFPTLKYGTGGTCGTGTTVFWGALTAAAVRTEDRFATPIKIPANNEICWITSTAGSKFIVITGFIAP